MFRLVPCLLVPLLAALCSLAAASCDVYDPSLLNQDGGDAGTRQEDSGRMECNLRRPPPRPTAASDEGDLGEIWFALRDVVLDQRGGRWRDIGLDLDGLCSRQPDPEVECQPPDETASPEIDGAGGIDNSFGHNLFPLIELTIPELDQIARMTQRQGLGAVLLRVRDWNGEANDPRVSVTVSQSVFGSPPAPDGGPPEVVMRDGKPFTAKGEPLPPPNWDGNDYWWVRDDTFVAKDAERPRVHDDTAYVADNQLVMTLPERVDLVFGGKDQGVVVRLTDARVVGRIGEQRQMLKDVIVAGRWSIVDLLDTAQSIGLCMGTRDYELAMNQIRSIADVRSRPGSGGQGLKCDAISVGVEFTGFRGQLGGMVDAPDVPNACAEDDGKGSGTPTGDAGVPGDAGGPDGGGAVPDGGGAVDAGLRDGGADGG
jgi:hypothetical protein